MNYEEEYNYNEEILNSEQPQLQPPEEAGLPKIVENWKRVSLNHSRHNDIPAIIGFYTLLGDMVKNMVQIPFGATSIDTRVHFCWIQTARTGKSTLLSNVLSPVCKDVYSKLQSEQLLKSKLVKFADYTTASLIGSHTENKKFDEDAQETYDRRITEIDNSDYGLEDDLEEREKAEKQYQRTKDNYHIHLGPIHGEGIWIADEFEGSGVFKEKSHKENMNIVFQTIMNNFHSGANKYEKILTGKPTIELDSRFSIIGSTFPPENLARTVTKTGILQRFLPYIWNVPDALITEMRASVIGAVGIQNEEEKVEDLSTGLIEIYKLTKERYEATLKEKKDNGEDKCSKDTVTYTDDARSAIQNEHRKLLDYIEHIHPAIRTTVRLFEQNLLEYICKLATLNCLAMSPSIKNEKQRFIVSTIHMRQAAHIVRRCYMALVEWLENSMKVSKSNLVNKSNWVEFQRAYETALEKANQQQTLDGGYVWKKLVLKEAEKILKQSPAWIYKKFNNLSDMFENEKKGKHVYVRPKMEEEK
tara:strand:+ start:6389 stop:7978 length:1590 start_codon:yes stop_codon:yes gene_type:complete